MIEKLVIAACLMLVLEGMMPFIAPTSWRQMMLKIVTMNDSSIRVMGLISMLLGVGLLYIVN